MMRGVFTAVRLESCVEAVIGIVEAVLNIFEMLNLPGIDGLESIRDGLKLPLAVLNPFTIYRSKRHVFSLTAVLIHVRQPGVFDPVFLLIGLMEQLIEAPEIGVIPDERVRLLGLKRPQIMDRIHKLPHEPVLFGTIADVRDESGMGIFEAHGRGVI